MIRRKNKEGKYTESKEDSESRANDLILRYFANAKMLKLWLEGQGASALLYCFVREATGRIRFFPENITDSMPRYRELVSQIKRWAGNFPIQCCCSSCLKRAVALIYKKMRGGVLTAKKILDAYIMLVAHDEIVINAADSAVELASSILKSSMEEAYNSICMSFNGEIKYLSDIKNEVTVITADYWAKD
jgi:DNA polymerase I-like protein with 3'-5' exonuclease and polymerase domains